MFAPEAYEKLGLFYLGRKVTPDGTTADLPLLYECDDLTTHGLIVGMTGSGKTGLGVGLLEEAALDGVPAIVIDPKGDMGNLALTFPSLAPESFRPWIDPGEAARAGTTVDEKAAETARRWREGLARDGQDPTRIQRLRDAAEVVIYTPGSTAGRPLSMLASLSAPRGATEDRELRLDRVETTVASLLGLLGIDGDSVTSREHILLAQILDTAWSAGRDLTLPNLVRTVQDPPFSQVGVLPLESFFPAEDRFALSMRLNNLLASPGFSTFLRGDPLDADRLLYDADGRPRISIVSIAHLDDRERMFVVSLLLAEILAWTRSRGGTSTLRALVYMDEIFGFLPPIGQPPSKKPLLTMLKQARAFGVGLVLATQNPVDLDYKALGNIGSWFLGRLQTERDKKRLLDGLDAAAAGGGASRREIADRLGSLPKRTFLLRNVHEPELVTFSTRWVLSYLRGPLTRNEISRLERSAMETENGLAAVPEPAHDPASESTLTSTTGPVLHPDVPVRYTGPVGPSDRLRPRLFGSATVRFEAHRSGFDAEVGLTVETDVPADARDVDWAAAESSPWTWDLLDSAAPSPGSWLELPEAATEAKAYPLWEKRLQKHLYDTYRSERLRSPDLKLESSPDEDERAFRIRLAEAARAERDRRTAQARDRAANAAAKLETKIDRALEKVDQQKSQLSEQRVRTVISVGETLLGAVLGRSFRRSAGTAARGVTRSFRESDDVDRAREAVDRLEEERHELETRLERELDEIRQRLDPLTLPLERKQVAPLKRNIETRVVLLWQPVSA